MYSHLFILAFAFKIHRSPSVCDLKTFLAYVSSEDEIKHCLWGKKNKNLLFLKRVKF